MLVLLRWEFVSRYGKLMLLMKYEIEENTALPAGLDLGAEGRNALGVLGMENTWRKATWNPSAISRVLLFRLVNFCWKANFTNLWKYSTS